MTESNDTQATSCVSCGREIGEQVLPLCRLCAVNENARFALVRNHLKTQGTSTIQEIADGTGLPPAEVSKYLRDGRLINAAGGGLRQPRST